MKPTRRIWSASLVATLLVVTGSMLTACGGGSRSPRIANRASSSAAAGREGVPGFSHVFLIIGENTSASEVTATAAPYLTNSIKPEAAW